MKYFKNLIFPFLLFIGLNVYAQGGWNIGYIFADSITTSQIGKRIKIDFKNESIQKKSIKNRVEKSGIEFSPIWTIRKMDSIQVKIENEDYFIYEVRKIGVDYGYFEDQYLILKNKKRRSKIYDSEILDIRNDEIRFRLFTGKSIKGTSEKPLDKSIFKDVWINKKLLDGVMYKK